MYGVGRRKKETLSIAPRREQSLKEAVLLTSIPQRDEILDEKNTKAACTLAYAKLTNPLMQDEEERQRWKKYMEELEIAYHILPNNSSPHDRVCFNVKPSRRKVLAVFGVSVQTRKDRRQSSRFPSPLSFLPHFSFRRKKDTDSSKRSPYPQERARSEEKKEKDSLPLNSAPYLLEEELEEKRVQVCIYWLGYVGYMGDAAAWMYEDGQERKRTLQLQVRELQRHLSWIAEHYMQKSYKSFNWRTPDKLLGFVPSDMRKLDLNLPTSSSNASGITNTTATTTEGCPASTEEPSSTGFSPHSTHERLMDFPSDRTDEAERQELYARWNWIEKSVEAKQVIPMDVQYGLPDFQTYSSSTTPDSSSLMTTTDSASETECAGIGTGDSRTTTITTTAAASERQSYQSEEMSDSSSSSSSFTESSSDHVMTPNQIMQERVYTVKKGDALFKGRTPATGGQKGVEAAEALEFCNQVYLFSVFTPPQGKIPFLTIQQRVADVIEALSSLLYIPSITSEEQVEEWSNAVQEALVKIPAEGPDDVERDRTALHFLCCALAGCSYGAQVKFATAVELMTDARLGRVTDARSQNNYLTATQVVIAALQQKLGFYLTDCIEKKKGLGWGCDTLTADDLDQVGVAVGKHIITGLHQSKIKMDEWGVNWIEKICGPSEHQLARNCAKWWERQCSLADKKLSLALSSKEKGKEEEEEETSSLVSNVHGGKKRRQVRVLTFDNATSKECEKEKE